MISLLSRWGSAIVGSVAIGLFCNCHAHAIDLNGRWASDIEACDKLFITKGGTTSFRPNSDVHGSGFIIQQGRIKGRAARCKINNTKVADSATHITGFDELEMTFFRCPPQ
jgi:hypothetical protein